MTEHGIKEPQLNKINIEYYTISSSFCRSKFDLGGVMIVTKNCIKCTEITEIRDLSEEKDIEITAIDIPSYQTIVIVLYRSPSGEYELFKSKLAAALDIVFTRRSTKIKHIFLMGDFNINFLENSKNTSYQVRNDKRKTEIMCLLESYGLFMLFQEPSRIARSSSTCIDNIFTNKQEICSATTVDWHVSDHLGQLAKAQINARTPANIDTIIKYRKMDKENIDLFKFRLGQINWNTHLDQKPADKCFSIFHEYFMKQFNECFPERERKLSKPHTNKTKNTWITEKIKKMQNILQALGTIAKVRKDNESFQVYKKYKQIYSKEIEKTRKDKNADIISKASNKQKAIWKIINDELGNTKKKEKSVQESSITADQLNNFFSSIGSQTAQHIKAVKEKPLDLIKQLQINSLNSCYFHPVTKAEIIDIVNNIKTKKAQDVYGISTELLKAIKEEIINPITIIINKCFAEGIFPKELKIAKVTPIHKKDDTNCCNNYRPISILPAVSKIFEIAIKHRLISYLEKTNHLNKNQHGYRKNKSTNTALLSAIQNITDAYDNQEVAKIAMCDLSKAFDTVQHQILLQKLDYYGVRGTPNAIIKSYLQNRSQVVKWDGVISDPQKIDCGVPQGSVIGPILFIIYINDLPHHVSAYSTCLFADDTSFITKGETEVQTSQKQTTVLKEAKLWFESNKLKINEEKTQIITFSKLIGEPASVKFLGVHIDNKLNWSTHIAETCKRLSGALYSVRRMQNIATKETAKVTYYSNFHSVATYGILLWGMASDASKVFLLQKRALRILGNLSYTHTCRDAFKKEKILTLPSVYILNCVKYVHCNPSEFPKNCDTHSINTRAKEAFKIPYHRLVKTQQGVDYWGVKLYNSLPTEIKKLPPKKFLSTLKQELIKHSFYSVQEFLDRSAFM